MSDRAPCVKCGRILHTGEGRVLVSLTPDEIEDLIRGEPERDLLARLRCAMSLLDPERAETI